MRRGPTVLKAVLAASAAALLTAGCLVQPEDARVGNDNTSRSIEIMLGFTGDQFEAFRAAVDPYAESQGIDINWAATSNFNQLINTRSRGETCLT